MGSALLMEGRAAEFPVLAQRVFGQALAYLDNAATTQMPLPVLEAMRRFETHDRANIHRGVHTLSQRATDAFDAARASLKQFIGAGAEHELVFTSGTTEALNLLANGLALQPGDQIIVSGLEHHANLVPWQIAARRSGARRSSAARRPTIAPVPIGPYILWPEKAMKSQASTDRSGTAWATTWAASSTVSAPASAASVISAS